jgi:hypothetical protein
LLHLVSQITDLLPHVELHNLTIRIIRMAKLRMTRLTKGLPKKWEKLKAACDLSRR